MKKISIVIPAYNEGEILENTTKVISKILTEAKINFNIVYVNDGSRDNTWSVITKLSKKYKNVEGICFSRNFGKEAAVFAGLAHADGDCVAVMDADLQHPPKVLIDMYNKWLEGYDVVEGVKASRGKESLIYKLSAKSFYRLISKATGIDMSTSSDFKLMDRKAVNVVIALPERHLFFRALSSWVGFKTTSISFEVQDRSGGESKWSVKSLIKYAIRNITTFSTAPMQIVTIFGVLFLLAFIGLGIFSIYKYIVDKIILDIKYVKNKDNNIDRILFLIIFILKATFLSIMLVILLSSSILMISIGIIGYYIAKIYEEVKRRPVYIISERIGNDINERKNNK